MIQDGVKIFLERFKISEKDFIEFGLKNIIFADAKKTHTYWKTLVNDIENNKEIPYVREFGRIPERQKEFQKFYHKILGIKSTSIDENNNKRPNQIFSEIANKKKKTDITNYKLSHIWGMTKNPYAFCACWNLCYTPIFIDPFTGHEADGELSKKFKKKLKNKAFRRFKDSIEDFNKIMKRLKPKIDKYLLELEKNKTLNVKDKSAISKAIIESFDEIKLIQ